MYRRSAYDQFLLWSDETWPQDIGALAFLDARERLLDADGRLRLGNEVNRARAPVLPRATGAASAAVRPRGCLGGSWLDAPALRASDREWHGDGSVARFGGAVRPESKAGRDRHEGGARWHGQDEER
jgi:hypothetical protein